MREERPKAQHSPLPWTSFTDEESCDVIGPDGFHIATLEPLVNDESNAKLIVASVNHAEKLAEALRKIELNGSFYESRIARQALADYEKEQQ